MARPGRRRSYQRAYYSGHKRFHCFSYQTITLPDGLIFSVYGPEDGGRHDMTLYSNSNMDEKLSNSLLVDDVQYCIYGDPACMLRSHLQVEFPALNAALT
jgi:DDE superfamily endonuclease